MQQVLVEAILVAAVRQDLVEGTILAYRVESVSVCLVEETLVGVMVIEIEEDRKVARML